MPVMTCDLVSELKALAAKTRKRVYVWGHVDSPYDGSFYENAVAFVTGKWAFVSINLKQFAPYREFVHRLSDVSRFDGKFGRQFGRLGELEEEYLSQGCVKLEDLDQVFRSTHEVHTLDDLETNTPWGRWKRTVVLAQALGLDKHIRGQFKCRLCGKDMLDDDPEYGFQFDPGYFHGDGGIGVDTGASPVCAECESIERCGYCGEWTGSARTYIDEDGHCAQCAPNLTCPVSGLEIVVDWESDGPAIDAYQKGLHQDVVLAEEMAADRDDRATGNLFEGVEP